MESSGHTSTTWLDGQVAIVTGASSGIGRSVSKALAENRAVVVVVGRTPDHVAKTVEEISTQCGDSKLLGLTLDVRDERDMKEMVSRTLDRFGRIDILVNSAGVGKSPGSTRLMPYSLAQLPSEEWDAIVNTNLKGTFLSNRAVLPAMIAQRSGTIINISSSPGGLHGQAFASAYCASKFAVVGLSQAVAEEVRQYNVRVEVLFPDATNTPLLYNSTIASYLGAPISPAHVSDLILYIVRLPANITLKEMRIGPSRLSR
jgi:3-oxoacyl-[acyl-carrier protein] reductase